MNNFEIIPAGDEFRIDPISDMAKSLVAHCRYTDNFLHPTYDGALSAIAHMDQAIENRQGRPWMSFRNEGAAS
jgi:hypothetical protein